MINIFDGHDHVFYTNFEFTYLHYKTNHVKIVGLFLLLQKVNVIGALMKL